MIWKIISVFEYLIIGYTFIYAFKGSAGEKGKKENKIEAIIWALFWPILWSFALMYDYFNSKNENKQT
jgi:hypothetical protein